MDGAAGTTDGYRARALEWLLLGGNRSLVALGFVAAFGVFFAALEVAGLVPLADTQSVYYAYSGLISGNLTLITVVVSINQLLLSRELNAPGELRGQIDDIVEYRQEVEAATGRIAPATPMGFLRILLEATREEAQRLGGFARDGVVEAGNEDVEEVVDTLTCQMDRIEHLLVESDAGTFTVLSTMLETNYAKQVNQLQQLRATHGAAFADTVHDSIDDLIDRLREVDVARQYFKSIYLQQELAALSRILLYAGLPAVAVSIATLLVLTGPGGAPSLATGFRPLLVASLTIGLVPLSILCSFILRTAAVTKLTAATLPFTTPEQER